MFRKPFFSIIIPVLNEEECLPQLLGDLNKQTSQDFEVIVADGGSTDQTIAKIAPFTKKLTIKILPQSKQNVSLQRNRGAKEATAPYLVFFDADVRIPTNFVKKLSAQIKKQKGYFYTTALAVNKESQTQLVMIEFVNFTLELFNSLGKPFVPGFNIIIEKGLFGKLKGFDPTLKLAEDHDLVQRARKIGVILKIVKEPVLYASFRRPEKIGYLKLIVQYAISSIYTIMGEPIRKELFAYPMGGHVYKDAPVKNGNLLGKFQDLKKQILAISKKIELPF
jgi:glycosyltransferase involved in cell wall biosynthesis